MSTMESKIKLRIASVDDAEALLNIYAPYVKNTAITYEYAVPSVDEFRRRIENTLKKYPYIVAEHDGDIVGYAYTGAFHPRAAYAWDAETSIYVRGDFKGRGLGRRLYAAIEAISRAQNLVKLYAVIACPDEDDEYLTRNSIQFHAHLGYKPVAEFQKCAYKFNRWYNMIYMEKALCPLPAVPGEVIPFPALDKSALAAFGLTV